MTPVSSFSLFSNRCITTSLVNENNAFKSINRTKITLENVIYLEDRKLNYAQKTHRKSCSDESNIV